MATMPDSTELPGHNRTRRGSSASRFTFGTGNARYRPLWPKPNICDIRGKVVAYLRAKLDRKVLLAGEFWLSNQC